MEIDNIQNDNNIKNLQNYNHSTKRTRNNGDQLVDYNYTIKKRRTDAIILDDKEINFIIRIMQRSPLTSNELEYLLNGLRQNIIPEFILMTEEQGSRILNAMGSYATIDHFKVIWNRIIDKENTLNFSSFWKEYNDNKNTNCLLQYLNDFN